MAESKNDSSVTIEQAIAAVQAAGGLTTSLGMSFDIGATQVVGRMTIAQGHVGGPGVSHGGAVSSLLDSALGATALQHALRKGMVTSTVELKVNFLRPAPLGTRLVTSSTIQSAGRSLLVVSGYAADEDTDNRVAFAVGTFNLYRLDAIRDAT